MPQQRPPVEHVQERGAAIARSRRQRRVGLLAGLAVLAAGAGVGTGLVSAGGSGLRFVVTGSVEGGGSCTVTRILDFPDGRMYFGGTRLPGPDVVVFQATFPRTVPTVSYRGQRYVVGPLAMSGVRYFRGSGGSAPATTKTSTGVTRSGDTVTIDRSALWTPTAGSTWVVTGTRGADGSVVADGCETLPGTVSQVVQRVFVLGNRSYTGNPVGAIEHGVPLDWWIRRR